MNVMNGMKKNKVSEYRHRVSLHRRESTKDAEGIATDEFVEWRKAWAKIVPLFGKEYYAAAAVQQQNNARFRLRGLINDITTDMRLCHQGRMFDIQAVALDETEYDTQLVCLEAKA